MMKRFCAALLFLCVMLSSLNIFAEGDAAPVPAPKEPVIPERIGDMPGVPAADPGALAVLKTRTEYGRIYLTFSSPVDAVTAQWFASGESFEAVEMTDGLTGVVVSHGHKCQIGALPMARQGEKVVDVSDIPFFNEDMTIITDEDIAAIVKLLKSRSADGSARVEVKDPLITVEVKDGKNGWQVISEYGRFTDTDDISVPDGGKVRRRDGLASLIAAVWLGSDGSPDYAYSVDQGAWNTVYGRSGRVRYFSNTREGTDYFSLGTGASRGTVNYNQGKDGWYVTSVREEYGAGKYLSITAYYNEDGELTGRIMEENENWDPAADMAADVPSVEEPQVTEAPAETEAPADKDPDADDAAPGGEDKDVSDTGDDASGGE